MIYRDKFIFFEKSKSKTVQARVKPRIIYYSTKFAGAANNSDKFPNLDPSLED